MLMPGWIPVSAGITSLSQCHYLQSVTFMLGTSPTKRRCYPLHNMTRIDFYLLPSTDLSTRLQLVCKLAEKAIGRSQAVFIHSNNENDLVLLDNALWDFRAMSFVAHKLLPAGYVTSSMDNEPVQLSCGEPANDRTVLINMAAEVPSFFSRFERTLEVVDEESDIKTAGRMRYRFYQQRGYPLQHHKM